MKDLILGNHLLFVRAGETTDGVVVGPEAMPDTTPSSNYIKFPTISDWAPKFTPNIVKRRGPSPGRYTDRKSILVGSTMEHAFSLQEFTEITLAELILGGDKPVGGVFVPGGRSELLTGWWIVQSYAQDDSPVIALNIWGEARIDTYKFAEGLDLQALIITQLYSSLTTGKIENVA